MAVHSRKSGPAPASPGPACPAPSPSTPGRLSRPAAAAPSGRQASRRTAAAAHLPRPRREGRGRTRFSAERCRPPQHRLPPASSEGYGAQCRSRAGGVRVACSSGVSVGAVTPLRSGSLLPPLSRAAASRLAASPSLRPPLPLPGGLGLRLRLRVGFPLSLEAPNMNSIVCAERHQVRRGLSGTSRAAGSRAARRGCEGKGGGGGGGGSSDHEAGGGRAGSAALCSRSALARGVSAARGRGRPRRAPRWRPGPSPALAPCPRLEEEEPRRLRGFLLLIWGLFLEGWANLGSAVPRWSGRSRVNGLRGLRRLPSGLPALVPRGCRRGVWVGFGSGEAMSCGPQPRKLGVLHGGGCCSKVRRCLRAFPGATLQPRSATFLKAFILSVCGGKKNRKSLRL